MDAARRRALITGAAGALSFGRAGAEQASADDLIILLPGLAGSALSVNGQAVWSPSAQGIVNALTSLGRNMRSLALHKDAVSHDHLEDGVEATSVVEDIHLIPGLWKINGYTRLLEYISALPGIQRGQNLQTFAYDWRRDNRVSARRLKAQAHTWLDAWRKKSGNPNARLVLLCHSMGGLVARYFVECLDGWKVTRSAITFGTPYRGAPDALRVLSRGVSFSVNLEEMTKLVRSFTSIYQLLPNYPCIEDQKVLRRLHEVSGLPNIDVERVRQAKAFHDEMNLAATRNQRNPAYLKSGYVCLPVVGVGLETIQMARRVAGGLTFHNEDLRQRLQGDGTVPRPSATPIELETSQREIFVNEAHGSLQNSERILSQIANLLLTKSVQWAGFRTWPNVDPDATAAFRINADAVCAGEGLTFRGRAAPRSFLPQVEVEVVDIYTERVVYRTGLITDDAGLFGAEIPSAAIPIGAYRARASFSRRTQVAMDSVSDVFCVMQAC